MQNNKRKRVKMCSLSYGIEIEIENTQMKNGGEDFVNFDNGFWLQMKEWWGGKNKEDRKVLQKKKAQDVK